MKVWVNLRKRIGWDIEDETNTGTWLKQHIQSKGERQACSYPQEMGWILVLIVQWFNLSLLKCDENIPAVRQALMMCVTAEVSVGKDLEDIREED